MNSKTKKKERSVKFLLQPRPQRDPLAADYEAPQHVLVPKSSRDAELAKEKFPEFNSNNLLPSEEQTRTGMLERAHQKAGMTFDSDLLEAMSKEFDYKDPNNILDDDFLDQAGGLIEDEGEMLEGEVTDLTKELFEAEPEILMFDEHDDDDNSRLSDDDSDDYNVDEHTEQQRDIFQQPKRLILLKKKNQKEIHPAGLEMVDHDDNKSVFTNYSMTSSVMRRSQGLKQLDDHFEKIYEKEYADDTEIGALDLNDVGGEELLTDINQIQQLKNEVREVRQKNHGDDYEPEIVSDHHKDAIIGDEDADLVEVEVVRRENLIDCESILSYNSNIYNHPKLIVEPRWRDARSRDEKSKASTTTVKSRVITKLSIRPSNESPEERRERKRALKAYRHERRQERKQNQQIFKSEQANIKRQHINNLAALKLA